MGAHALRCERGLRSARCTRQQAPERMFVGRFPKTEIQGLDPRVSVEEIAKLEACGLSALFGTEFLPKRFVIEIGFGRGEFLFDLAQNDPEAGFLGVDVNHKRVLKMAHRVVRNAMTNVRIFEGTGQALLAALPAVPLVTAFWINFPDPWPKRRHERRRMLRPEFIHELAMRLVQDGRLEIATDNEEYALGIDTALRGEAWLANRFAPHAFLADVPGRKPTAYELLWRAEGRKLHFWSYTRK